MFPLWKLLRTATSAACIVLLLYYAELSLRALGPITIVKGRALGSGGRGDALSLISHNVNKSSNTQLITNARSVLQPVIKMQPSYKSPHVTEEQKQRLLRLTENELTYEKNKAQMFNMEDEDIFNIKSSKETLPIYVDWDTLRKRVNESWYNTYPSLEGKYKSFQPTISLKERIQMLATLEVFIKACEWANVTYFLCGGTQLGSHRHHGFVPWDDDIDVIVKASHWKKLYYVLSKIFQFSIYTRGNDMWKFHLTDVPQTFSYPYKWPFIDVNFYAENTTHWWGITRHEMNTSSLKSELFPLIMRPFEHMWAPVPCNSKLLMARTIDTKECKTSDWSHKRENIAKSSTIQCNQIQHVFPFVFEEQGGSGSTIDTLRVGNRTVQTFISPPVCTSV